MKLGHIAVFTKNMEESIAFYSLLGGKKGMESILDTGNNTSKHLVHMEFDGEATVELVCPSDPSMFPAETGVCEHFCFDVENVDETVAALREKGIDSFDAPSPYTLPIFGGIRIIFLTGPNGEIIELFQKC